MDQHPIVAYNADHEVLPYDTVLPTRQQHIEGNDNVTIGDQGSHVNIPEPEAHADRSNPLYDLRTGHMCAFIGSSIPKKKVHEIKENAKVKLIKNKKTRMHCKT
jgi:hypothetical protein